MLPGLRRTLLLAALGLGAPSCALGVDDGAAAAEAQLLLDLSLAPPPAAGRPAAGALTGLEARVEIQEAAGGELLVTRYRILMKWPNRWRFEVEEEGKGTRVYLGDDQRALEVAADGAVIEQAVAQGELGLESLLRFLLLPRWFQAGGGGPPALVGGAAGDEPPRVVTIAKADEWGNEWVVTLDGASLRPRTLAGVERSAAGGHQPCVTYFDQFALDDRRQEYPARLRTFVDGALKREIRFAGVTWTAPLPDRLFEPLEAAAPGGGRRR